MRPLIALVGRPNVGKSTLFNKLTHTKDALVADLHALTRDRQYGNATSNECRFTLIDTPGIILNSANVEEKAQEQTKVAIAEADIIFFILSAKEDLVQEDYSVAAYLRKTTKQVLVLLNKIDGVNTDNIGSEIYKLGWPIYPISSMNYSGVSKLMDSVLPPWQSAQNQEHNFQEYKNRIHISIIGRPNVGKSTLINHCIGQKRLTTYDVPGTTRDSIAVPYTYGSEHYLLIDTAGIRKRKTSNSLIDKFAVQKTLEAVKLAQISILTIDAIDGLVEQDLNLIHLLTAQSTTLVIAVNKTDKLDLDAQQEMREEIQYKLSFIPQINVVFISAVSGYGIKKLHKLLSLAHLNANKKFSTNKLTNIMMQAVKKHEPPLVRGKRIKMRFAHQGGNLPLIIVIHGNQLNSLSQDYQRYLRNFFYQELDIQGAIIKLIFKQNNNPYVT